MKIPRSLIENFLTSEFTVIRTQNPNEVRINSPFNDDKKGKLYISLEKGSFIDFKEQVNPSEGSGSILKFVKRYFDLTSERAALIYLIKNYGTREQKEIIEKKQISNNSQPIKDFLTKENPTWFRNGISEIGKKYYNYLLNRKIDERFIQKMGYVFNPGSEFDNRIIIPYFENGEFVYFQARDIAEKSTLRYRNPTGVNTKEFVFNIDDITDELIICEGPMDALSMDEQVATCMCSGDLGISQINKIFKKAPKSIIYVPDQDATGLNNMSKNINKLFAYCPYTSNLDVMVFNVPKGCKDLNDMKIKTGKNFILRRECEPFKKSKFRDFDFSCKSVL